MYCTFSTVVLVPTQYLVAADFFESVIWLWGEQFHREAGIVRNPT